MWNVLEGPEVTPFVLRQAFSVPAPSQHAQGIIRLPQGAGERQKRQESVASRIYIFSQGF